MSHRHTRAPQVLARSCLAWALATTTFTTFTSLWAAEPAAINWSAEQTKAAAIRTEVLGQAVAAESGITLQGTVVLPAQATEVISTPLAGVVQSLAIQVAQPVRPGQMVAQLQSPQLLEWQRDWIQADAQSQLAQDKLRRDEQLYAEGIIAELRLRETRTQARLAQVSAEEKRQALRLAGHVPGTDPNALSTSLRVTSRSAGTVLELLAAPGQRLEAGAALAKVARDGQLAIELQATPAQLPQLRLGQMLEIEGCSSPARLVALAPQVSSGNQAILLRAELAPRPGQKDTCLRLHQFVLARAQGSANGALTLPAAAVVRQAGQAHVFVKRGDQFVPTPVALSGQGGARLVVLQGVKAGDEVVVQGTAALKGAWLGLGAE